MATVDFTNIQEAEFPYETDFAQFSAYQSHTATSYVWTTVGGHRITATGTGIAVNGGNVPLSGTISQISIDLSDDNNGSPDIVITDLSIELTSLPFVGAATDTQQFWDIMLAGSTAFVANSSAVQQTSIGDFYLHDTAAVFQAADDTFSVDGHSGSSVLGDGGLITNGLVLAGNDTITGSFASVNADVGTVKETGRLVAGDDRIVVLQDNPVAGNIRATGDVTFVQGNAVVIAGNDFIDMRQLESLPEGSSGRIYGDVQTMRDAVFVQGGNDTLYGTQAQNYIFGDSSSAGAGTTIAAGDDTIYGGGVEDTIYGDVGLEHAGSIISGGDDLIYSGNGDDEIFGGGGNDRIYAGSGADVVRAGDGDDYVRVGGGVEQLFGGSGEDYISYYDSAGGITIDLQTNSVSRSWASNDQISGFTSVSTSKTGNDIAKGTDGDNVIRTYGGNDSVHDRRGDDRVSLGSGDDYVRAGGGADSYDGGSGVDYISYYDSSNGVTLDLRANTASGSWASNDTVKNFEGASGSKTGDDTIRGTDGANVIRTYGGDDYISSRDGDDRIVAGDGDDSLLGGDGADTLEGGNGADFLDGGNGGLDTLFGGDGADTFHFDANEENDVIKDFEDDVDTIEFDNFAALTDAASALAFAVENGNDVFFDFGGGDTLLVENATKAQLLNDIDIV